MHERDRMVDWSKVHRFASPVVWAILVVPMFLPALGESVVAAGAAGDGTDADSKDSSLIDLALRVTGVRPHSPQHADLVRQLEPLRHLEPEYEAVVRSALEGLAKAQSHQAEAMRHLDPEQRSLLLHADPRAPSPAASQAAAAIDRQELIKALAALETAGADILSIIQSMPAADDARVAQALRSALGASVTASSSPMLPSGTLVDLISQATGTPPGDLASSMVALDGAPEEIRLQLAVLMQALRPFASGAPEDPERALVDLGSAIDVAEVPLLLWSTLAMAAAWDRLQHSSPSIPDPGAAAPPLHYATVRLRDPNAPLPPAPSLGDALRHLAWALGDSARAQEASEAASSIQETLGPDGSDAVARILAAAGRDITAHRIAARVPVPAVLAADPGRIQEWAGMLDGADLPAARSPEARELLAARPFLSARLDAALAREDLLTAIQQAVPVLAAPAAAPAPEAASGEDDDQAPGVPLGGAAPTAPAQSPFPGPVPCDEDKLVVPGLLAIDPCGSHTVWDHATDRALLVIDLGGNDTYHGRFAGAPFQDPNGGSVPHAFLLDLGGNDTYDAAGVDCALGAACPPADLTSPLEDDPFDGDVPPLAVLVDWDGDGVVAENRFLAGNRSMGYGSTPTNVVINDILAILAFDADAVAQTWAVLGTGLFVERIGSGSMLDSHYGAGNFSQGSGGDVAVVGQGGVGVLLRLVGKDTEANGAFEAGTYSQGSNSRSGGQGIFLNIADAGARSDDTYLASDRSRGYLRTQGTALFVDALLPDRLDTDHALAAQTQGGVAAAVELGSTGPTGRSDDSYSWVESGNGNTTRIQQAGVSTTAAVAFIDLGGEDTYPPDGEAGNDTWWPTGAAIPAGIDDSSLQDHDGDLLSGLFEDLFEARLGTSDEDGEDVHPVGRRALVNLRAEQAEQLFLNQTYSIVINLFGNTEYGPGFSAAVLLDLGGNDWHRGRSAAAAHHVVGVPDNPTSTDLPDLSNSTEPTGQHVLSFLLDLDGSDRYESPHNGSQGFGDRGASGLLFDLGGSDVYRGSHFTQGVGLAGGVGVLADIKARKAPLPDSGFESNRFHVDGSPSQGHGERGGLGLLIADGDHNTFSDGQRSLPSPLPGQVHDATGSPDTLPLPLGFSASDSGASVNAGDNSAPRIRDWNRTGYGAPIVAGQTYTFNATAEDDDGDPLLFCWTFGHGSPSPTSPLDRRCAQADGDGTVRNASVQYTWINVPTDARIDGIAQAIQYPINLTVTDPGGKGDSIAETAPVQNLPLRVAGDLLGPQTIIRAGDDDVAFQLPFVPDDQIPDEAFARVDWGDGSVEEFSTRAINWAHHEWGATVQLPIGFPVGSGQVDAADLDCLIGADTCHTTHTTLRHDENSAPPTVAVWFDGPRQIRSVSLESARSLGSSQDVRLAVEAVREDGSSLPLGIIEVTETSFNQTTWDLEYPALQGLVLRQLVDAQSANTDTTGFLLRNLTALGPGAFHSWESGGSYAVNYTLLDRFGGQNGTTAVVDVTAGAGTPLSPQKLVTLEDLGGRGLAHNASLAFRHEYELALHVGANDVDDQLCVDWGDGNETCEGAANEASMTFLKQWNETGDYPILVTYYADPEAEGVTWQITTAHVERAIDLVVDDLPLHFPLLFVTLEPDRDTWHAWDSGLDAYPVIVDAGGDDRYVGPVARSLGVTSTDVSTDHPNRHFPSLLVDGQGDDDYLHAGDMAQAFATRGGVALLLDAGGDDRYVAGNMAQGAATLGGIAALLDLGGDDAFNPVPSSHPVVRAGYASAADGPWLQRPDVLEGRRIIETEDDEGVDLAQGASNDGTAVLLAVGGYDVFHARTRAQGYGAHGAVALDHYLMPGQGAGLQCPSLSENSNGGEILCRLGIAGYQDPAQNTPYYTMIGPAPQPTLLCQTVIGNPQLIQVPAIIPCGTEDTTALTAFLASGPRYGAGLGALLRLGGSSSYHALSDAQGSARPAGRGILFDSDGGATLLAGERSQAFSRDGLSGVVLGGNSVLRLDDEGQATFRHSLDQEAPEGGATNQTDAAILVGTPLNIRCNSGCGDSDEENRNIHHDIDPTPGLPAPDVTVSIPTDEHFAVDSIGVEVDIEGVSDQMLFERVALATAYAGVQGDACVGKALAAPVRLAHDVRGPGVSSVTLDPSATVGGEVPLLPAGCTEVHVFARAVADVGGTLVPVTEWGRGADAIQLLPPPRVATVPGGLVTTNGLAASLNVMLNEPLAAARSDEMGIRFRVTNEAGTVQTFDLSDANWSGSGVTTSWQPAPSLSEGPYGLDVRVQWPDTDSSGAQWTSLGQVLRIDRSGPEVTLQQSTTETTPSGPLFTLGGVATDVSGVSAVLLRLNSSDGPIGSVVAAHLDNPGAADTGWSATLGLPPTSVGGALTLQISAVDIAGATTDWQDAADLIADTAAPTLLSVRTSDGLNATNGTGNVTLRLTFRDGGAAFCPSGECPGSGVEAEGVMASVLLRGPDRIVPLERLPGSAPANPGNEVHIDMRLQVDATLPEGDYDLFILARDATGNLFDHNPDHDPAFQFIVDRTQPSLSDLAVTLPDMTLPDGTVAPQTAVKPGDPVHISVTASDAHLDGVRGHIGANATDLDPASEGSARHGADLNVSSGTDPLPVWVTATDAAGNSRVLQTLPSGNPILVPFHDQPLNLLSLQSINRSESVTVAWRLDRPLDLDSIPTSTDASGMNATLLDRHGNVVQTGHITAGQGPGSYEVLLRSLQPETDYRLRLDLWDGANHTLQQVVPLRTLPAPDGVNVAFRTDPGPTRSGTVPVQVIVRAGMAVSATLRLHAGDAEAPPVAVLPDIALLAGESETFVLEWDTEQTVGPQDAARDVELHVVLDDLSRQWTDRLTLRIDNRDPVLTHRVVGPAPNNGWYNGTVDLRFSALDDTHPLQSSVVVDGVAGASDGAVLSTDGDHRVTFSVLDGAVPPNHESLSIDLSIDRTLPTLDARIDTATPWTRNESVPLVVSASDATSGLDGFRWRIEDAPWTAWTDAVPDRVSLAGLGDGEHWIEVEVRDRAHNTQRVTTSITLDRAAPELVSARWVGRTGGTDGTPVVHVVARDRLDGEGLPSGVEGVRFAAESNGTWGPWTAAGPSGTFPVPQAADGQAVRLQLRDRVGNVAANASIPGPDLPEAPQAGSTAAPAPASLLRDPAVSPTTGAVDTRFTFAVTIHPLNGSLPDEAFVQVGQDRIPLHPEGPVLDNDARLHTATTTLPATRFGEPHAFTITVRYGETLVTSPSFPGPSVQSLPSQSLASPDEAGGDGAGFLGIPTIPLPLLVLLLAATAILIRNRRHRS